MERQWEGYTSLATIPLEFLCRQIYTAVWLYSLEVWSSLKQEAVVAALLNEKPRGAKGLVLSIKVWTWSKPIKLWWLVGWLTDLSRISHQQKAIIQCPLWVLACMWHVKQYVLDGYGYRIRITVGLLSIEVTVGFKRSCAHGSNSC